MADFLTRLAGRTLGLAPTAQPIIAPLFAPGPALAGAASPDLIVEDAPGKLQEQQPTRPGRETTSESFTPRLPTSPVAPADVSLTRGLRSHFAPPEEPPSQQADIIAHLAPSRLTTIQGASLSRLPVALPAEPRTVRKPTETAPAATAQQEAAIHQLSLPPPTQAEAPDRAAARHFVAPLLVQSQVSRPPRPDDPAIAEQGLAASPAPTIQVTIGRVEVRATLAPNAVPAPHTAPAPKVSLDAYLRASKGGQR